MTDEQTAEKLTVEDCENFWEYLQAAANDTEYNGLSCWLEERLEIWKSEPAHSCGCRKTYAEHIWSKTRNHCLQTIIRCSKCKGIVEVKRNSDELKQLLKDGKVRVADVETLKAELGII